MRYYAGAYGTVAGRAAWVARTGYTGEDGFEIFCAAADCEPVWDALRRARRRCRRGRARGARYAAA